MRISFKNITPQVFFVYAAVFFILLFNIVTPPLQAPDEFNHFYRAYQIAEGQFLPNKTDNRVGGEIPNSINEFFFQFNTAATEMRHTVTLKDIKNSFGIRFSKDSSAFKDFPNTSYYSPVSYLPQAIAIFIARKINCSVGTMYYTGRLFIILTWLFGMYFVIKTVPQYKWLFTVLCLLPMNLFIVNSFSADTMSNILSFLFMALVLKHTFSEKQFDWKNLFWLLVLISLIALAKVVYVGLALSFLIIPFAKFKRKAHFFLFAGILFFVAFIVAFYWSRVVMSNYMPYVSYNPKHRDWICLTNYSNYYEQKAYILNHGTYFLKVIYRSIFRHPLTYLYGYIGLFGNSDIPLPAWLIWISYTVILFMALFEENRFRFNLLQKVILFSSSFCAFVLLLLSQHLTWDAVGEGIVDLVQGRYLTPIFPLVFLTLGNYKLKAKINYVVLLIPLLIMLYGFSTDRIWKRYYVGACIEKKEFTCDAEKINSKGLFVTSDTLIFLEAGASKTDSVAHSGKSSLLLTEQSQYGFMYKFNNLNYGDLLEVSLWEKGKGAGLVVSNTDERCGKIYCSNGNIQYYDKNGWGKLHLYVGLPEKCKNSNLIFYVWNSTKEKIYVDDLQFTIKRFAK